MLSPLFFFLFFIFFSVSLCVGRDAAIHNKSIGENVSFTAPTSPIAISGDRLQVGGVGAADDVGLSIYRCRCRERSTVQHGHWLHGRRGTGASVGALPGAGVFGVPQDNRLIAQAKPTSGARTRTRKLANGCKRVFGVRFPRMRILTAHMAGVSRPRYFCVRVCFFEALSLAGVTTQLFQGYSCSRDSDKAFRGRLLTCRQCAGGPAADGKRFATKFASGSGRL